MSDRPRRRIFLWVFLAINLLFLVWVVSGAMTGAGQPDDCGELLTAKECNDAADVGTTIGVAFIVFFWFVADFILAVGYGIYRLARR